MSATSWEAILVLPVSPDRDHIRGPIDALVTLVEYGDYECPHCAAAHPVVTAVQMRAGPELRFCFRHFPITTAHPHAQCTAEAAEAAGDQGKFWAMHDTLFQNQEHLEDPHLLGYARALGLDLSAFAAELSEHRRLPKVREDFMSGVRSGVNGTPTFFINGVRHDGPWDFETLFAAVRQPVAAQLGA